MIVFSLLYFLWFQFTSRTVTFVTTLLLSQVCRHPTLRHFISLEVTATEVKMDIHFEFRKTTLLD